MDRSSAARRSARWSTSLRCGRCHATRCSASRPRRSSAGSSTPPPASRTTTRWPDGSCHRRLPIEWDADAGVTVIDDTPTYRLERVPGGVRLQAQQVAQIGADGALVPTAEVDVQRLFTPGPGRGVVADHRPAAGADPRPDRGVARLSRVRHLLHEPAADLLGTRSRLPPTRPGRKCDQSRQVAVGRADPVAPTRRGVDDPGRHLVWWSTRCPTTTGWPGSTCRLSSSMPTSSSASRRPPRSPRRCWASRPPSRV